MSNFEKQYKATLQNVLRKKNEIHGRNGVVRQQTGITVEANLEEGFPIITGRKAYFKNMLAEARWMLKGDTNTKYLKEQGVSIWDLWADENGNLGPIYGHQMRNFNGVDQIQNLLKGLKTNRFSRRHIVNFWNPNDLDKMALPPCHFAFEVVANKGSFDIVVFMRSLDLFVGLPYDIGVYSLYLIALSNQFNVKPGKVVIMAGNAHVYSQNVNQAAYYCTTKNHKLPRLNHNNITFLNFQNVTPELINYTHEKPIKVLPIK